MGDLISREQSIVELEDLEWYHIFNGELKAGANSKDDVPLYKAEDVYAVLQHVPSAEKIGKWIEFSPLRNMFSCSVCGQWGEEFWNYCPHCGARMEE